MSDLMFLVLLATLVLLAWWLVSKVEGLKESIEHLQTENPSSGDLKDTIKDAVLEALEERDDPYPAPPQDYPGSEGMKEYEAREKDWKERHGR
jgi:hypothetical protein